MRLAAISLSILWWNTQYELSIGGEKVSEKEWQQLVASQTPLVQFRGQWMELDQAKMQEMMVFWKKHRQDTAVWLQMAWVCWSLCRWRRQQGDDVEVDFSRDRAPSSP